MKFGSLGKIRQYAQLDLRIIGDDELSSLRSAEATAVGGLVRDLLEVRIRA